MAMVAGVFLFSTAGANRDQGRDEDRDKADDARTSATEQARPPSPGPDPCPPADGSAPPKATFAGPPPECIDQAKSYAATVVTDVGAFTVELDDESAPYTVNNFVFLARYHFYDNVPFHRVIPGFVVQGGAGEKGDPNGGPGYAIEDELPEAGPYEEGSVAMANTGRPNTGGSQYFVVTGPEGSKLPPNYALFGDVTAGLEVVKRIEADGSPDGTPRVLHRALRVTITESADQPAGEPAP